MAEIKISDLSIGDWVRVDDFDKVLIKRVSAVDGTRNQIGIIKNNRSGIYWYYEDEIEPIPLTPEILEKNGISKTYESDEYAVYKGEGFNVTEYYTELWEFEKHRNRLMIRNVHQLQNALRLAGVEKEIEV